MSKKLYKVETTSSCGAGEFRQRYHTTESYVMNTAAVPSIVCLSSYRGRSAYIVYCVHQLLTHPPLAPTTHLSSSLACPIPACLSRPHSHPNSPILSPLSSIPAVSSPLVYIIYFIPTLIPTRCSGSSISSLLTYLIPILVPTHCLVLN